MLAGKRVVEVNARGAIVADTGSDRQQLIEADQLVVALGAAPVRDLADALAGNVPELCVIGDCQELRTALEAITDGFLIGNKSRDSS